MLVIFAKVAITTFNPVMYAAIKTTVAIHKPIIIDDKKFSITVTLVDHLVWYHKYFVIIKCAAKKTPAVKRTKFNIKKTISHKI